MVVRPLMEMHITSEICTTDFRTGFYVGQKLNHSLLLQDNSTTASDHASFYDRQDQWAIRSAQVRLVFKQCTPSVENDICVSLKQAKTIE